MHMHSCASACLHTQSSCEEQLWSRAQQITWSQPLLERPQHHPPDSAHSVGWPGLPSRLSTLEEVGPGNVIRFSELGTLQSGRLVNVLWKTPTPLGWMASLPALSGPFCPVSWGHFPVVPLLHLLQLCLQVPSHARGFRPLLPQRKPATGRSRALCPRGRPALTLGWGVGGPAEPGQGAPVLSPALAGAPTLCEGSGEGPWLKRHAWPPLRGRTSGRDHR